MRCNVQLVALVFLTVAELALAQCSDPCTVASSVDAATAFEEDSELNAIDANIALTSIDNADILGGDDSDPPERRRALHRRQGSTSVCCNVEEVCLSSNGIPLCFNQATTELRTGDGFYGFVANSSYYAPDGSPIDPATGATLSASGSMEASAPTSAAMSMASGLGSSTMGVTTSTATSGSAGGKSTLSVATPTQSAPGLSTGSEPAKTSVVNAQATGQASLSRIEFGNTVAAAGLVILWIVGAFY